MARGIRPGRRMLAGVVLVWVARRAVKWVIRRHSARVDSNVETRNEGEEEILAVMDNVEQGGTEMDHGVDEGDTHNSNTPGDGGVENVYCADTDTEIVIEEEKGTEVAELDDGRDDGAESAENATHKVPVQGGFEDAAEEDQVLDGNDAHVEEGTEMDHGVDVGDVHNANATGDEGVENDFCADADTGAKEIEEEEETEVAELDNGRGKEAESAENAARKVHVQCGFEAAGEGDKVLDDHAAQIKAVSSEVIQKSKPKQAAYGGLHPNSAAETFGKCETKIARDNVAKHVFATNLTGSEEAGRKGERQGSTTVKKQGKAKEEEEVGASMVKQSTGGGGAKARAAGTAKGTSNTADSLLRERQRYTDWLRSCKLYIPPHLRKGHGGDRK